MKRKIIALLLICVLLLSAGCTINMNDFDDAFDAVFGSNGSVPSSSETVPGSTQGGGWPSFTWPGWGETTEPRPTDARPTAPTAVPTAPTAPMPTEPNEREYFEITVWVSDWLDSLTYEQIQRFNETNTYGFYFDASISTVSDYDAANHIYADPEGCADIFCFSQDQTQRLYKMNALSPLGSSASAMVRSENSQSSVMSATVDDMLVAYPMTADNGYFMYYDKSVISEADVDSLERLIQVCVQNNLSFTFALDNAWYMASFFFATGCVSQWEIDSEGNFVSVYDTFNSPQGIIAARGMQKLLNSPCHDNYGYVSNLGYSSAVVISGTWDYVTAKGILGDNLGIADLPSFTVDGERYHLGSFSGSRLMGVKPQEDSHRAFALHILAQYLTGEACQMERYGYLNWGPSNLEAQRSPELMAAPQLQALFAQDQYAVPQGLIYGSWWDFAKEISSDLYYGMDPAEALNEYDRQLGYIFAHADNRYAWSAIGMLNGTSWTYDWPMMDIGDGLWMSMEAFYMDAGTEFKVRQGGTWDVNYGADGVCGGNNYVVETAGTYFIIFDTNTCLISLYPA